MKYTVRFLTLSLVAAAVRAADPVPSGESNRL